MFPTNLGLSCFLEFLYLVAPPVPCMDTQVCQMYFLILHNLGDNYYSGKSQIVILCNVLFVDFLCIPIYHCTGAILQDTAIIVFVKLILSNSSATPSIYTNLKQGCIHSCRVKVVLHHHIMEKFSLLNFNGL